jgi:hypothetical protein
MVGIIHMVLGYTVLTLILYCTTVSCVAYIGLCHPRADKSGCKAVTPWSSEAVAEVLKAVSLISLGLVEVGIRGGLNG